MSDAKTIWMHLLAEGRCDAREIAEKTRISIHNVRNAVKHMENSGSVRKFGEGSVSFGVTRDCTIPQATTIRDLEAGGVRLKGVEE